MFREESNKFVIIALVALVAVVLVLVWRGTGKVSFSQPEEKDMISVSATANVEAQPDKAELYLKIETLNKDVQKSQEENSRISDNVITELTASGVAKKDIETTQYYLDQKIRYGREGEQIVEGYVTLHVLRTTTAKTTEVGKLVDAAMEGGANGINSIAFTLSDSKKAELRNEALGKAAAEAKEKAEKIAESLGVRLGKLHTVSESSFDFRPYYAGFAAPSQKSESTPTQIQPQAVEVTATLQISYFVN